MRSLSIAAARLVNCSLLLTALGTSWVTATRAATPAKPASPNSAHGNARELVTEALQAELAGNAQLRADKLAEALRVDPDNEAARWHSGFVKLDGGWVALGDVPARTKNDTRLAAYRKRREGLVDTADNQRELARWCQKQHLNEQARVHWTKLLEFEPQNAEAIAGLGLQLHEGRLMTRAQIEQHKKLAGEQLKATRHWQPKLVKWRRAIEAGSSKEASEAVEALSQLDDPLAIPALETTLAVWEKSDKASVLNGALIQTVGRMQVPEATQVLLRQAVWGPTRELACEELKKRPMHTYVPQLIALMPDRLSVKRQLSLLPGGTLLQQSEVLIEGRETEYFISSEAYSQPWLVGPIISPMATARGLNRVLDTAERQFNAGSRLVTGALAQRQQLADQVKRVLKQTTGFEETDDPRLLDEQWRQYSESYPSPRIIRRIAQTETSVNVVAFRGSSCFSAGTPVLTDCGLLPIESLKPGDRVLSQNPATGQLAYKLVQATTLTAPSKLIALSIEGETIRATRGHPFWVNGQAWRMAKFLEPGQQVHSLQGPATVDSMLEEPPREVYNLVVNDWHNYFVGNHHVLVHDNSPLEETAVAVPGLLDTAAPASSNE